MLASFANDTYLFLEYEKYDEEKIGKKIANCYKVFKYTIGSDELEQLSSGSCEPIT